ncbi:MAG: hypothetical protein ACYTFG_11860, partial [Planctomycetota bacterium]
EKDLSWFFDEGKRLKNAGRPRLASALVEGVGWIVSLTEYTRDPTSIGEEYSAMEWKEPADLLPLLTNTSAVKRILSASLLRAACGLPHDFPFDALVEEPAVVKSAKEALARRGR